MLSEIATGLRVNDLQEQVKLLETQGSTVQNEQSESSSSHIKYKHEYFVNFQHCNSALLGHNESGQNSQLS